MSNRQQRRLRKQRQLDGLEVFVHVKPTKATVQYETRAEAQKRRRKERAAERVASRALGGVFRYLSAARKEGSA